jgi:hypothetical protein
MRAVVVILAAAAINAAFATHAAAQTSQRSIGLSICRTTCQQQGAAAALCAQYCDCMQAQMDATFGNRGNLATPVTAYSQADQQRIKQMIMTCGTRVLGR